LAKTGALWLIHGAGGQRSCLRRSTMASEFPDALAVAGGAAEDLVDAVARKDGGDADRHRQLQLGMAQVERMPGHAAADPFRGVERAVRVEMIEQQREGVAAIAR